MKLLFDENLQASLVELLAVEFPRSNSVTALGFGKHPDIEIIKYARDHGFILVTKDVDFYRHCVARGYPPKVIWMRTGNCSVAELVATLQKAHEHIEKFEINDEPYLILK